MPALRRAARRTTPVAAAPSRRPWRPRLHLTALIALALGAANVVGCSSKASAPDLSTHTSATRPRQAMTVRATRAHADDRGLPTFVWLSASLPAGQTAAALGPERVAEASLRAMMGDGTGPALASARLVTIHDVGRGAIIVEYDQVVDGREVFLGGVRVALARDLTPLAATGTLYPELHTRGPARLSVEEAISVAAKAMAGVDLPAGRVKREGVGEGDYEIFSVPPLDGHLDDGEKVRLLPAAPARVKPVWFPEPSGLVPAYAIELDLGPASSADSERRAFVVDALAGRVMFHSSMTASDAYAYRVFADGPPGFVPWDSPQGTGFTPYPYASRNGSDPAYVAPALVTLKNAPFSKNDPWLPLGALELLGNNARAYVDRSAPDGVDDGDLLVPPTSPGRFDHPYEVDGAPESDDSSRAAATQLFYVVNFLHDQFYDAGWNEVSRNPQRSNFGRGGAQNDGLKAEAQDGSGRNNANATTPADGSSPRIQMYLYDSFNGPRGVSVTAPEGLAGTYPVIPSRAGPRAFEVSGAAVRVDDGDGAPGDACESPFVNAAELAGKVALIDAGTCGFPLKAYNAQRNGAVGVIIAGVAGVTLPNPLPSTPAAPAAITIPVQGLVQVDGDRLKTGVGAGAVEVTLSASPIDRDGALDLSISAHEWTHVMTGRLIGNGSGLSEVQARGLGEGWSDFVANLVLTRAEDAASPANVGWNGAWAHAAFANASPGNDAHYTGNRRYPISADFAKNPLTFTHIQDGVELPSSPAPRTGQNGANNAEVHATGEVWAEMLWECYVALLRDTARYTFAEASRRMREYLVAALKLTPSKPTFLEARDALLVAAYAGAPRDHTLFYEAFARRGAGVGAEGPSKTTTDNTPVIESFSAGHAFAFMGASLDDSADTCDADGVLDNGEAGKLSVTVRNVGPGTLGAARVEATTTLVGASFPRGASATFPPIPPYGTGTAVVEVALAGARTAESGRFDFTFSDPELAPDGAAPGALDATVQFDDRPSSARVDTMDGATTPWSAAGNPALSQLRPFKRVFVGQEARWHIDGNPAASDQYLISPPLELAAAGAAEVTFRHRHQFAVTPLGRHPDGGVLEISRDRGATWTDLSPRFTDGGYNGTIDPRNGPLGRRSAFVGESASYPDYTSSRLTLPAEDAGKTVLLRFRAATDDATGSDGWDIDDFAVKGLVNTPFGARVSHRGVCVNRAPVANAGPPQRVPAGARVELAGSGTDRDGDALTYAWTQTAGAPVTLSDPAAAKPTFTAPTAQTPSHIALSLVARDATLASAPSTVEITVDPTATPAAPPSDVAPSPDEGCASSATPPGSAPMGTAPALALGLAAALLARRRGARPIDARRRPR